MSLKIGVIGFGYWGPNLVRNFYKLDDCEIIGVADANVDKQQNFTKLYPHIKVFSNPDDIINNPKIDAIVIATPASTHYKIALKALESGKHVLVEKPMVRKLNQLYELIDTAKKNNLVLMVDHTFLYNGAVHKIKEIASQDSFGKILSIDAVRINLGIIQNDMNVMWDLACHDLSVINHLVDEKPYSIQVNGISHLPNKIENIAYLCLRYESNLLVNIHVSWSSPVKIRQMLIGGEHKMIMYNDIQPTDKLKIYDKNFTQIPNEEKDKVLIDYRLGDVYIPKFNLAEPLSLMAKDFYDAITYGKEPVANWHSGLKVITILEKADESLKYGGKEVKITQWDNLGQ